jgi:acyl-CoA thioesterase FadM
VSKKSIVLYQAISDIEIEGNNISDDFVLDSIIFEATITLVSIDTITMRSIAHPKIVKQLFGIL